MLSLYAVNIIYLIVLCCFNLIVRSESVNNITIPLNKTLTFTDKELYGDFTTIKSYATVRVNFSDVSTEVSFIIFQVHSHLYNITLYNNTREPGSVISGTNVGLYSSLSALDTFYISNSNNFDLKIYISVHGYGNMDPIPGGANMEFPIYISPFMYAKYNKDYVNVDAQPAQAIDNAQSILKFYRMYLRERDFTPDSYFEGIRNMLTKKEIEENGYELQYRLYPSDMRRYLSAYPGTGSVYVAVAYDIRNASLYSVYVPTYTYACSPLAENGCAALEDTTSIFFCALLLFIGLFICYFGHKFFKTEMFILGMFLGIIVTYILISMLTTVGTTALIFSSVLSGLIFGAIWLLVWSYCGIPVISVLMANLHLGFLLSSIFYYRMPDNFPMFIQDSSFWLVFIMIMVLTPVALVAATFLSNILCCSILGAYAVVFCMDHFIGSNLKYIIINIVRRATVAKFKYAAISPPFQWRDALVTIMWVMLTISGAMFQHYHSRGKPPFPPPPRSICPCLPILPTHNVRNDEVRRYGAIDNRDSTISGPNPTVRVSVDERTPLYGAL